MSSSNFKKIEKIRHWVTQQPCYIRAEPTQGRQCRRVPLIGILFDNDKITTE